jgi:hypothetical protein
MHQRPLGLDDNPDSSKLEAGRHLVVSRP